MAKINGIWVLNSILTVKENASGVAQLVNFTANAIAFDGMILLGDYTSAMTYSNIADSYNVYTHSGGWVNEAYRIVDFGSVEQEVSDEWYIGFTSNATKAGETNPPEEGGGTDTPEDDEILLIRKSTLRGIANAVRSKTGKTEQMLGSEIEREILSITGSGLKKYDGTVEVV